MKAAEEAAKYSECSRRKYGAVITGSITVSSLVHSPLEEHPFQIVSQGWNKRIGRCCDGNICVRDRFQNPHGEKIEQGSEIHAEAMALLHLGGYPGFKQFYLACYDNKGELLTGERVRPCHYCGMMLRHMGFENIIIRDNDKALISLSIGEIMEVQESVWEEIYP